MVRLFILAPGALIVTVPFVMIARHARFTDALIFGLVIAAIIVVAPFLNNVGRG